MQKIKLSEIECDLTLQPRSAMQPSYVTELAELLQNNTTLPPITVYSNDGKKGPFYLADGFHRFAAAAQLTFKTIDAEVLTGTAHHAFKYSLGANVEHGMRRTNADKRRAVMLALGDAVLSKSSSQEIAKICFVSGTFVDNIRAEQKAGNEEEPEERVNKKGKTFTVKPKPASSTAAGEEQAEKKHVPVFDAAGFEVPEEREDLFNRSKETQTELLSKVSEVRSALRLKPQMFAYVSSEALDLADALYAELKPIALEHVCPKCHGKGCPVCHDLGLMPKSFYKGSISDKDKI